MYPKADWMQRHYNKTKSFSTVQPAVYQALTLTKPAKGRMSAGVTPAAAS